MLFGSDIEKQNPYTFTVSKCVSMGSYKHDRRKSLIFLQALAGMLTDTFSPGMKILKGKPKT